MRLGLQTFTIRKSQKKDIKKAYLSCIELGIFEYEVARIDFNEENARILKELVDDYKIKIVSIQVKPKIVFHEVEKIVQFCKIVGCKNVVISMLPFNCILGNESKFHEFLNSLDTQYDVYKQHGLELAYHHHDWEYVTLSNGKMRMDEIIDKTSKIKFVHDTYWTTRSGIDCCYQMERFGSRLIGMHVRDVVLYQKGIKVFSKNGAIGEGIVDFKRIFKKAKELGCEYFVFEQNTKKPYEMITKSIENSKRIIAEVEE